MSLLGISLPNVLILGCSTSSIISPEAMSGAEHLELLGSYFPDKDCLWTVTTLPLLCSIAIKS